MDGVLTLIGDPQSGNNLKVTLSRDGRSVYAVANNSARSVLLSRVSQINVIGGNGDDLIAIDPRLSHGVKVNSMAGYDTIFGGAGDDTIIAAGGDDLISGRGGNDQIASVEVSSTPATSEVPLTDGGQLPAAPTTPTIPTTPTQPVQPAEPTAPVVPTTPAIPTQPAEPAAPTIPTAPVADPMAPTAVIASLSSSYMVGSSLHVQGLESVLRSGDALSNRFEWDFGDAGSKYNNLAGWNAAHVYDKAGTYTITLKVTDAQGRSDVASLRVTIAPNTRHVVYVDRNGNDANDGSSANRAVATVSRAMQLLGDNTEILFKRGQTFDVSHTLWIASSNVVIGSYGAGVNPTLRWTRPSYGEMFAMTRDVYSVTFENLKIDSLRTGDTDMNNMVHAIGAKGTGVTVRGIEFRNVGYAINANGAPHGLLVQDNTAPLVTGVREYFTWFEGTDGVFLGNVVANSTRQHVVRMMNYDRMLFAYNDFTNLDRTKIGDPDDRAKGGIVAQEGAHVYVTHNTLRGGGVGIGPLGQDNVKASARTKWAVVEANQFVQSGVSAHHGLEDARLQGNLMYADGRPAVTIEGYSTQYQRGVLDLHILDNVAVNNASNGKFLTIDGVAHNITLTGNTYYAPNMKVGDGDHTTVNVFNATLNALTHVDRNLWIVQSSTVARGSFVYAWKGWSESGLYTPDRWNEQPQVGTDQFIDLRAQTYVFDLSYILGTTGA